MLDQMLTADFLPPQCREPDSTYFDLPQPSRGNREAVGNEETSMDVFHLPGMVSGAVLAEDEIGNKQGSAFLRSQAEWGSQGFGWPTLC